MKAEEGKAGKCERGLRGRTDGTQKWSDVAGEEDASVMGGGVTILALRRRNVLIENGYLREKSQVMP